MAENGRKRREMPDQYLSDKTPEQEQEGLAAVEKALEMELDKGSDAKDREIALLREQLAEARAKVADKLEKKWVFGDWAVLPPDHPIEVVVHANENPAMNYPVKIGVNGKKWYLKRGEPVIIPRFAYDVLLRATIDAWHKIIGPDDTPKRVRIVQSRFPHNARPLPGGI